jgi:hypothetical protein
LNSAFSNPVFTKRIRFFAHRVLAGGWKSMNVIGQYVEHVEIGLFGHMLQRFLADIGRRR